MANNIQSDWREDSIPIKDIVLDGLNPRIDDSIKASKEAELIAYILENTNSEKLAREIVDKQDIPELESLILLLVGEKYIVLEGNRRVAVYKALLHPELAPENKRATFVNLSKRVGFTQTKLLKALIAPDREAAAPLLRSKHLQNFVERWDHRMQANFDSRLKGGSRPNKANLRRAELYSIVKKLDLPAHIKKIVDNDKDFAFTTLDRVVFSSAGQEFLGFHIGDDSKIEIDISKTEFEKGLKKIVSDVATKVIEPKNEFGRTVAGMRDKYFPQIEEKWRPDKTTLLKTQTKKLSDVNIEENNGGKGVTELDSVLPTVVIPPRTPAHSYSKQECVDIIINICVRFNLVSHQIASRYDGRTTLNINDEYDVQDLFQGLLKLYFDDVRREEYTPSTGGKSNRFDLFLKQDKIGLEIKKTRKGLNTTEKVANELYLDLPRYKGHPDCEELICFVYDPEQLINNPKGLEKDIEKEANAKFGVKLIVNQNP